MPAWADPESDAWPLVLEFKGRTLNGSKVKGTDF